MCHGWPRSIILTQKPTYGNGLALYKEHGTDGLCTTHGTYSGDFKVSVVGYMHDTGASLQLTAARFNILFKESVSKWGRIYHEEGKEALYEGRRGRALKMGTRRSQKPKADGEGGWGLGWRLNT